ncbi:MAG TPA: trypsin-like peptidase domain-containing protein [Oscillatoriaceae cyanobacterium M33_DOE_052]|uniref:Serine protease n=1 Tax=Planktothricoides sp. SpSt-374 TaxID=2282167 RepID=A0A7C3VM61_9CYAN|nr:trypsin-like peptidase domain-containing protein [Oscillatoriaceae cyanobacterium M33_DOE_052]
MNKKLITLFFASLLGLLLFGNWSLFAGQSSGVAVAQFPADVRPAATNVAMQSAPYIPENLAQSDDPFDPGDRAIIGEDNRIEMRSRRYPWTTVGRLEIINEDGEILGHCTGTLIAEDIVITNAHCVVSIQDNRLTPPERLQFQPNLINGIADDVARGEKYIYGTDFPNYMPTSIGDDWALVKIDKHLGDKYGFLGWTNKVDFANSDIRNATAGKMFLAGYAADFPKSNPGATAGVNTGCSVVDVDSYGRLLHDCDTNPGASGSAIFGKFDEGYYILGVHAGAASDANGNPVNYAMQVSRWAGQVAEMQN